MVLTDAEAARARLREMERTMAWLARQVGLCRQRVQQVFSGAPTTVGDHYGKAMNHALGRRLFRIVR